MRHIPSLRRKNPILYTYLSASTYSSASFSRRLIPGGEARKFLTKFISAFSFGSLLGLVYYSFDHGTLISQSNWATIRDRISDKKLSLSGQTSFFLFGDSFRRKIFFNYEKRIRLRSAPEKVFEYFASHTAANGELMMTPADLMRAVIPVFPPEESSLVRDGYLRGERNPGELRCDPSSFFMLFDTNNDGLISFKEYIFLVTLLSVPECSFSVAFKMFDINNSGEIDRDEFKKVMALMRNKNRQGVVHRDGLRTGMKVYDHVENGGLVEYFFGIDGKTKLKHDKFVRFLQDLDEEILRLEFEHYDYKSQRAISAKNFALTMVAAADLKHLHRLLLRVDELAGEGHFRDMKISFEEFKNFAELRKKLTPFSLALFSYGKVNNCLNKEDLKRAAHGVCDLTLSDNVVDVIFHVFDTNRDGTLSFDEFLAVLHNRERDVTQRVQ